MRANTLSMKRKRERKMGREKKTRTEKKGTQSADQAYVLNRFTHFFKIAIVDIFVGYCGGAGIIFAHFLLTS